MVVEITTNCPECGDSFSRKTHIEGVIAGCTLDLCPKCVDKHTDKNGDFVVVINSWIGCNSSYTRMK